MRLADTVLIPEEAEAFLNGPEIGDRLADFESWVQVGSGGMGVVYRAHQRSLNRTVALKTIRAELSSPAVLRRFLIEGEAAARLDHPNIVPIYEINDEGRQPFISMKFIAGDSLKTLIKRGRYVVPPKTARRSKKEYLDAEKVAARLVAALAHAIHHAHEQGVFHRDLKPGNILLDDQGHPYLTDFGLAKILTQPGEAALAQSLTVDGTTIGTPEYMSPEQALGKKLVEETDLAATDIYSLGVILYELLTGHTPHRGGSHEETLRKVREEEPKRPRAENPILSAPLETICLKCLMKNPLQRYASAELLAQDLERWLEGKPILARRETLAERTSRWIKRNPIGAALIATLFLGMLVVGYFLKSTSDLNKKSRETNRQLEIRQAMILDTVMENIRRITVDPDIRSSLFEHKILALLDGREPVEFFAGDLRLKLGANIDNDPYSMAIRYARALGLIETNMTEELGRDVVFDLNLFKMGHEGYRMLISGEADFMLLNAVDYLEAKKIQPGLVPVVREAKGVEMVWFANTNSGITTLQELKGKSIAFCDHHNPAIWWAKNLLAQKGIHARDLGPVTNFLSAEVLYQMMLLPGMANQRVPSEADTVTAVLAGDFDAGLAKRKQFERHRYRGLVELDSFESSPNLIVARAGLNPETIQAFIQAILPLPPQDLTQTSTSHSEQGFVPVEESFFRNLEAGITKVTRNFEDYAQ
jgi:serine/threonine protein kinase